MDGEEDFLDDDLDEELQVLEQNALATTQSAFLQHEDTERPVKDRIGNSLIRRGIQDFRDVIHSKPPASAPDPPSSDYGLQEGDVVDLDESSTIVRPASAIPERRRNGAQVVLDIETSAAFAAADAELVKDAQGRRAHARAPTSNIDHDPRLIDLQARIAELESDRDRLRRIEEAARDTALQKNGEIAVVRSNHAKVVKEYEGRIAALQKQHLEDAAKHKAEMESGRREREKMATDNRFLQHDLAQETEKVKRRNDASRPRVALGESSTPKRLRRVNLGDGFDDDEVIMPSPSKSRDGSRDKVKNITPRQANKRKRSAADSPVGSLSFAMSPAVRRVDEQAVSQPLAAPHTTFGEAQHKSQPDNRYDFMQLLLRYRTPGSRAAAVEQLGNYQFPSQPFSGRSLSSLLLEKILTSPLDSNKSSLPVRLAQALANLWTACLDQEYYAPICTILDLLQFSLYKRTAAEMSELIGIINPLCLRSIQLVYYAHVKASIHSNYAEQIDHDKYKQLAEETDIDGVVIVLTNVCQVASLDPISLEKFWQSLPMEDVLLMLNKALPLDQIFDTLSLLRTSVLPTTFGPICTELGNQNAQEVALLDRLSGLLFEIPVLVKVEEPYSDTEIAHLRLGVLDLFKTMCEVEHGGILLAQHRTIIGRLLRFLNGQISRLYTTDPLVDKDETRGEDPHSLTVKTINASVRIIYYLLRAYDSIINISEKLSVTRGGYHVFLVSMTRLAFSEQLVYEHGIEDEVAEAAHLILDNILSPEEGDAIREAVETPRGSKDNVTSEVLAVARGMSQRESQLDEDTTMNDIA